MSILKEVNLGRSALNIRERRNLNPKIFRSIIEISRQVRAKTVIHINATPSGGGVAELLRSQVPLERALGLKSRWFYIRAPRRFFDVTKKIHNLLQGKAGFLSEKEKNFYLSVNRELAESLRRICGRLDPGVILVHDPQPSALIRQFPAGFFPVCRIHIDLSTSNPAVVEFLRPFISRYEYVILSSKNYRFPLPWLKRRQIKIIMPAIDPFSEKNRPMSLLAAQSVIEKLGVNPQKPIMAQVSRFDPWKDPLGVIRAYYLAKNKIPDLQLVLAGLMTAKDDPEAIEIFQKVKKYAKGDPDIYLFSDPRELGDVSNDVFINALYTASDIVVQKSIREGFGLTMTEAMWKGKAVIAGRTAGALLQIQDGKNGVLIDSPEEAAKAAVRLLKDEKLRERLGRAAHFSVKRKFLFLRSVLDHLKIYQSAFKNLRS